MTKKGLRTFDSREAVLALGATSYDGGTALEVVLRHTEPAVRPDDVLTGLQRVGGLAAPGTHARHASGAGPLRRGRGDDRRPVIRLTVTGSGVPCAILDTVERAACRSGRPDDVLAGPIMARHSGAGRHRTATRPG